VAYIDTVKQWFLRKKKPTQSQFHTLFDYLRWKDEAITMADIAGLVTALVSKVNTNDYEGQLIEVNADYTYTIPAGHLLEKMVVYMGTADKIRISKVSIGNEDVMPELEQNAGWNNPIVLDELAVANTDLFIEGITAGSKICFIKRKIKMI
jgi:hypothetical protein